MNKKVLGCVLAGSLLLQLFGQLLDVPDAIRALMPLIYLGLSLFLFKGLVIGYRILHLLMIVPLILMYIYLMITGYGALISDSGLERMTGYYAFSSLDLAYIVLLLVLGISYLPYGVYSRLQRRRASTERVS